MNTDKEKQENEPIPIITETEGIHWKAVTNILYIMRAFMSIKNVSLGKPKAYFTCKELQYCLTKLEEPMHLTIEQIELIMEELRNNPLFFTSNIIDEDTSYAIMYRNQYMRDNPDKDYRNPLLID
jgi:hypothetical protein